MHHLLSGIIKNIFLSDLLLVCKSPALPLHIHHREVSLAYCWDLTQCLTITLLKVRVEMEVVILVLSLKGFGLFM